MIRNPVTRRLTHAALAVAFWLTAFPAAGATTETSQSGPAQAHPGKADPRTETVLIRNTTVIDGTGAAPQPGVDLLIRGDRIEAIGESLQASEGARILDGTGKFVVPGLIDTHVHLQFPIVFQLSPEEKTVVVDHTPKAFLYNGVTTVLNVSAANEWILPRREAQRNGELVAPTIYALGESFKPVDGWGSRHGGALEDAAAARRMALELVDADVDGFKLIIEDGLGSQGTHVEMPDDMLQAIAEVASENGMPLYSHAINLHEYHRAVDIGSRAIIHGLEDPIPEGDTLIEELIEGGITVVPTASLFESFLHPDPAAGLELQDPVLEKTLPGFLLQRMRDPDYMAEEKRLFSQASNMDAYTWAESRLPVFRENITRLHEAGVKLAVGTDGGGTVGYNYQGYNTPWELKILVECGLTPMEALVAATRNGAEVIGIDNEVGTVETGKLADLLILTANPLDDIENIRRIEWIIQQGQPHPRDEFAFQP
ncbi:amidohydrolase family protein [Elongatibacter sediminis]|uniref:Amidohydrolase family protein n=1 Tax=Elongatibacter sediminis TaxID=3119006 RepID=A0AAW9R962_9GAMM